MQPKSDVTDAQSAQVTEQAANLAALQGASEDARTREHRSTSPAPDVRPGAYSASASRQNAPKFHGGVHQYPMWRKEILLRTYPFLGAEKPLRCGLTQSSSVTQRVIPSELRRSHSAQRVTNSCVLESQRTAAPPHITTYSARH